MRQFAAALGFDLALLADLRARVSGVQILLAILPLFVLSRSIGLDGMND